MKVKYADMKIAGLPINVSYELDGDAVIIQDVWLDGPTGTVNIWEPVRTGQLFIKGLLNYLDLLSVIEDKLYEDQPWRGE